MMYPPRQAARKDPWKTTIHGSPLQPSRFMNHSRQQKLLQMKREEEMNHHSVKVQNMTAKRTEGKPDPRLEAVEASSPGENTVSPTPPPEQATDPDWADVDEYNSFKAKLEEQALSQERVRRQNWLRGELEAQLKEQRHQKEVQKREEIECARELRKELDLWKAQEQEKQKNALEKMLHQKEVLDAQMQERQKLEEVSGSGLLLHAFSHYPPKDTKARHGLLH
ncbi:hypothetical protein, conserved [Eimeria tenella]|uniref:Uncharacterized protein n=1 Tax=Eimeria tenella TaxID=5802 RepID=U6KL56_EIMTE|nr:hypothetical protein, conserved [Eimeria tenella]CDJ36992.1 hypothetical protein, conserved [Eimeria tenella]|eukprot:XP_013227830.1 hypothetical protein, conserved [Eimeria tenella]